MSLYSVSHTRQLNIMFKIVYMLQLRTRRYLRTTGACSSGLELAVISSKCKEPVFQSPFTSLSPRAFLQTRLVIMIILHKKSLLNTFFSCNQAALWMVFSARPSRLFDYVPITVSSWNFSRVITNDHSDVHAKGQGDRSKVEVTEVNTQLNRFRTVTPVWIHMWWWNDAKRLMLLGRGALLFFNVIRQISTSYT